MPDLAHDSFLFSNTSTALIWLIEMGCHSHIINCCTYKTCNGIHTKIYVKKPKAHAGHIQIVGKAR